jgi:hypothetical protein
MPINHRTTFKKKCPDTYQERLRYPGCSLGDKPFQPQNADVQPGPEIPVKPVDPGGIPVNPFHPFPIIPGQPFQPPYLPKPIIPGQITPSPPGPGPGPYPPIVTDGNLQDSQYIGLRLPELQTQLVQAVRKTYPALSNREELALDMAQSAYIFDQNELTDFISKTSIAKSGFVVDDLYSHNSFINVYDRGNETIIAIRGTHTTEFGADMGNNINNVLGTRRFTTQQTRAIVNEVRSVMATRAENQFTFTGHSKGGAESRILQRMFGGRAIVFNSAPTTNVSALAGPESNVTSIRIEGDGISILDRMNSITIGQDTPLRAHSASTLAEAARRNAQELEMTDIQANNEFYMRARNLAQQRFVQSPEGNVEYDALLDDIDRINVTRRLESRVNPENVRDSNVYNVQRQNVLSMMNEFDLLLDSVEESLKSASMSRLSAEAKIKFFLKEAFRFNIDLSKLSASNLAEILQSLDIENQVTVDALRNQIESGYYENIEYDPRMQPDVFEGDNVIDTSDTQPLSATQMQEDLTTLEDGPPVPQQGEQPMELPAPAQEVVPDEQAVIPEQPGSRTPAFDPNEEFGPERINFQRTLEETTENVTSETITKVNLTETLRAAGPKGLAGLGLGIGASQLLSAAGVKDPVANTAISSAAAGSGAEALDIGAAGLRNVLAENIPKLAGIKSATKFTGSALLKGMTRGAGEGLLAGMAGLPVDMLLNHYLTVHSGGAGMSHTAAGAISSAAAGGFSGLVMGGLAMAAGEASTGAGIPLAVMTLLFTGIGAGLGAIFGKMDDDKIQTDKEDIQRQTQFLIALQNNSFDMSKTDSTGLSDDFIQSVQNALDGTLTASKPILTDDEIEKQRKAALDSDYTFAKNTHGSMKTLARSYQRTNRRFDDMKQTANLQREFSEATNVYVTAKINSMMQLSLQEHARENGQDTFTFNGQTLSTSGDYSFKSKDLDIDTDRLADIDPNWQSRMDQIAQFSYTTSTYQANEAQSAYTQVLQYRIDNPNSSGLPDSLTQNQRNSLNRFYPDIETDLATSLQPVIEERQAQTNLRNLAQDMSLSLDDFAGYAQNISNGADPTQEYNQILTDRANAAGYMNVQDYVTAFQNPQQTESIRMQEQQVGQDYMDLIADNFAEVNSDPNRGSFYSADEAAYPNAIDNWTPDQSYILRAHQMGMTLHQFNTYMEGFATVGKATKPYAIGHDAFIEVQEESEQDKIQFEQDLVYHGYKPNAYKYELDSSGVTQFVRNESVPLERSGDVKDIQYFIDTFGKDALPDDMMQIPDLLQSMTQRAIDANSITVRLSNTSSLTDWWSAYSRPHFGPYTANTEPEYFKETPKMQQIIAAAKAGQGKGTFNPTGMNDYEIYQAYEKEKQDLQDIYDANERLKDGVHGTGGYYTKDQDTGLLTFHPDLHTEDGVVRNGKFIDSYDTDEHPVGSDYIPKGSTSAPKGSTSAPKGSTSAPKGSTAAPKGSTYTLPSNYLDQLTAAFANKPGNSMASNSTPANSTSSKPGNSMASNSTPANSTPSKPI